MARKFPRLQDLFQRKILTAIFKEHCRWPESHCQLFPIGRARDIHLVYDFDPMRMSHYFDLKALTGEKNGLEGGWVVIWTLRSAQRGGPVIRPWPLQDPGSRLNGADKRRINDHIFVHRFRCFPIDHARRDRKLPTPLSVGEAGATRTRRPLLVAWWLAPSHGDIVLEVNLDYRSDPDSRFDPGRKYPPPPNGLWCRAKFGYEKFGLVVWVAG